VILHEPLKLMVVLLLIFVANPLVAFILVLLGRYSVKSALTISASLAQTGEFSFILAGLGATLDLLPPQAHDLILAGSLLSITTNPLSLAAVPAIHRALSSRRALIEWVERAPAPRLEFAARDAPAMRDHVIIVGHGRVGGVLSPILGREGLPMVVIERDRALFDDLKQRSIPCVYGDATARDVLKAANVEHARTLIVALLDSFQVRRILEIAR
jgi:monovalent cation:H+ antiporter-2, CPA2 family